VFPKGALKSFEYYMKIRPTECKSLKVRINTCVILGDRSHVEHCKILFVVQIKRLNIASIFLQNMRPLNVILFLMKSHTINS